MTVDRRSAIGGMGAAMLLPSLASSRGRALAGGADVAVTGLTTEWRSHALGIDTLRPRFGWRLTPVEPDARSLRQTAWEVVVGSDPQQVRAGTGDIWKSGAVAGDDQRIRPPAPLKLSSHRRYWWTVRVADRTGRWSEWSVPDSFVTGVLSTNDWTARWIAAEPDRALPPHIAGQAAPAMVPARPLPVMRRSFALISRPTLAVVSVCGLGQYQLAINGRPVGPAGLAAGWTDYRRTVLYDTYDVTGLLRDGDNMLALSLGNGMYNVEHQEGRYTKFLDSFGQPKATLQLSLQAADGSTRLITTDSEWSWAEGPIQFSSIYGGEDWDARSWPDGWDRGGADRRAWLPVIPVNGPGGELRAAGSPAVIVADAMTPLSMTEPAPGVVLVDFGVNFAGRPVIELRAKRGATLVAIPGETLDGNGRVTQQSFNAGPGNRVEFRYTAAGGVERFEPQFSYHGFRYLELSGVPRSAIVSVRGHVLHADIERIGTFDAAPVLLGQIHRLIDRAVTSNMVSVLTDCPHREKLGWLEQTYLNAPTVLYNRDAIPLYEKMVRDIADAQQRDGMVPGIAPEYVAFIDAQGQDQIWRNSPEWGAAAILAPWAAYRFYGDATILHSAWPAAVRYCDYLAGRSREWDGLLNFGMGDWYDVGPNPPGEAQLTSRALTGTAIYIQTLETMAQMAPVVGRNAEARRYAARARWATARFNRAFLDRGTGRYERGSQTAQAMPLALGLVPAAFQSKAQRELVRSIRREGNGVTAGDIGFRYVIDALSVANRDDIVLDMLNVRDRPSYAWQLAHGATTLTEAWDANPTKSLDHFMLGHAEGWFYRRLAGLDVDHSRQRGDAIRIAPRILHGIDRVSASYRMREGVVSCAWKTYGALLEVAIEVPVGRRATIVLPTSHPQALREGGRPVALSTGIRVRRVLPTEVELVAGSGRYRFTAAAA